ncbi:MAG: glycosyltransferase family 4 protein [Nanoarchaeota archaeon]
MNLNPIRYLENTITPFERWFSRFKDKKKMKIGWCGVFPPYENGGAAVSYYVVKELLKRDDIEVAVIPVNKKIEKKLFKGVVFCSIDDPALDVVIFSCLGHEFKKYALNTKAKKVAWQTIHYDPLVKAEEEQFKDIENADLKIFMTKWAEKKYKKLYNLKERVYVPFGVDTNYFRDTSKDLEKKKFQISFVSRAHYKKGIMPFLDAIPLVVQKCSDCIFYLHSPLDKFSPYFEEIEKKVQEMKKKYLNNFFVTNSWVPYSEMKKVYENSSILIFPSNNEGFGIPIIEAMSSGIPCIVSDVPPLNELVNNSVGFCLKQKKAEKYHNIAFPSPEDIAEKILVLRANPQIYAAMQERSRARVKKEYELKNCVDLLVHQAKGLCEKKSNSRKKNTETKASTA